MKDLYIIRHGETELNRLGIVQGRGVNSDLNENGKNQAAAFYKKYHHIKFDKIYISSLVRTKQTVSAFINDGIPFESWSNLDEMSWGDFEGQTHSTENSEAFAQLNDDWKSGNLDAKFDGGESPNEVAKRLKTALIHIFGKANEKNVLICMHGRALRIILCLLLNKPLTEMNTFTHSNTTLYHLRLHDNHKIELISADDTSHLI